MKKLFTLIELIVVIVVLGILAAIVVPNISNMKEDAIYTAFKVDKQSVQLATDMYFIENKSLPVEGETIVGGPKEISFNELIPNHLRSKPEQGRFWIIHNNIVHGSLSGLPSNVSTNEVGLVTWDRSENAVSYQVYERIETVGNILRNEFVPLEDGYILDDGRNTPYEYQGSSGKNYFVSSQDKYGNSTPVVGTLPEEVKESSQKSLDASSFQYAFLNEEGLLTIKGCPYSMETTYIEGNINKFSAGDHHVLILNDDNSVSTHEVVDIDFPSDPEGNDFIDIAAQRNYNLALKEDGSIIAWGKSWGHNVISSVPNDKGFTNISAGEFVAGAIKEDGSILVWGDESSGLVVNAPTGNNFKDISIGHYYALALKEDGTIVHWSHYLDHEDIQINIPSDNDFIAISSGENIGMALKKDGTIITWDWGYADRYEEVSNTPTTNDFIDIAAGGGFAVAMKEDGTVVHWGKEDIGCLW